MQLSPVGFLVCLVILVSAFSLRGSLLTALIASLAFGSTSIVTLGSLGGSSPLIYTVFALLLAASVLVRKHLRQDLGKVLGRIQATWVVGALMIYAAIGAFLLPRLFVGQTSAFVPSRTFKGVFEVPLEPVSGNITQLGYLALGGVTFLCVCIVLLHRKGLEDIRRGFLLWSSLHTAMGVLDLASKLAGLGDILKPLRTANYAMLTQADEAGFSRITGAYSEASAFGGVSLACLAFTYTYWRKTNSRLALVLSLSLLVLLILSTSSTAYVGLTILCIPVALSIARSFAVGRVSSAEIMLVVLFIVGLLVVMAISLRNPDFFRPFMNLLDSAVFDKVNSASGQERAYWNYKSLQSFLDTGGLGIGIGSSRASSWPIAVLSQLGLLGAIMMAALLAIVARPSNATNADGDPEIGAVVSSVRMCALAGIVSGSLISGSADPGIVFFVAVAVVCAGRVRDLRKRPVEATPYRYRQSVGEAA
ncbi:hypothetical protein VQ042_22735 [Aurantimonas sp. A2-1-M11]|uniref:hypothetical protein n=1 Tax=Aurantimonas sp. A2-1-M11 TaxID=3113712 RepID=UPI002F9472A9